MDGGWDGGRARESKKKHDFREFLENYSIIFLTVSRPLRRVFKTVFVKNSKKIKKTFFFSKYFAQFFFQRFSRFFQVCTSGVLVDFLEVCTSGVLGGNFYFDAQVLNKTQKKNVFGNITGFVKHGVSFLIFFFCDLI